MPWNWNTTSTAKNPSTDRERSRSGQKAGRSTAAGRWEFLPRMWKAALPGPGKTGRSGKTSSRTTPERSIRDGSYFWTKRKKMHKKKSHRRNAVVFLCQNTKNGIRFRLCNFACNSDNSSFFQQQAAVCSADIPYYTQKNE